ncbi:type I methionyl aminopeptidase [Candidatus Wolfebacteria bacterium RBG_13_41_7]|uniref:Methionine aminopeptidase n=1 Tax=Candidatus Wolfebacteria bacterium RBG_13_41_7 TaxID=1802554 RepID=A0A1F8DLP0_9BACT|nr:MAG: type I methionyl aminopeptidase [Candidatus Wolfebacteria bacterium RBG_13_41_7]
MASLLKSPKEIKNIAVAGKILVKILKILKKEIQVDIHLKQLDNLVYQLSKKHGVQPAFLGYRPDAASRPFGASICASLNDVIVHGLPNDYKLQSEDILKIDFGVEYRESGKSFFADSAFTVGLGKISKEAKILIKATKTALEKAVKAAKPGSTLGDIGYVVERVARENKLSVLRELTGHGTGLALHEDPVVYNFGEKGRGMILKPGMVLAIEPMLSTGSGGIIQRPDESWATADGGLAAHFEHTIVITKRGRKILT